ncbi:hypothetical protein BU14_0403s0020 [Porphyra umbilicalis]|uniref:Uncharacterized protein n=1 Tax=Porphyra umbilicalis TaxID=2786 RepID=A0A1X6NW21_PORUM|nr:hypothetical protein BU14_0403s0020 [Porphyra umbilicalis]|eukprot:OSX72818.1 hypothetical protein BU14_0403s0020 [Porphyra umbilicalis]
MATRALVARLWWAAAIAVVVAGVTATDTGAPSASVVHASPPPLPAAMRPFTADDFGATFTKYAGRSVSIHTGACPATELRFGLAIPQSPGVYAIPHSATFLNGIPCGQGDISNAEDVAFELRYSYFTVVVAAPLLETEAKATVAGVLDVYKAVTMNKLVAAGKDITGSQSDVMVGYPRKNLKTVREDRRYNRGTVFFFSASDGQALASAGVAGVRIEQSQPFVISVNPQICMYTAPTRAAVSGGADALRAARQSSEPGNADAAAVASAAEHLHGRRVQSRP